VATLKICVKGFSSSKKDFLGVKSRIFSYFSSIFINKRSSIYVMVTGYCVKCKEKGVQLEDAQIHKTAKGGFMAKGKHKACGTTVCAMMSKDNAEKAMADGDAGKAF
jgi:hypothetical protein